MVLGPRFIPFDLVCVISAVVSQIERGLRSLWFSEDPLFLYV